MHFGESLVQLKSDILAEYSERKAAAHTRRAALLSLRDDVRQELARNAAQRVELAKIRSTAVRTLREKLADDNAQLSLDVEQKRKDNIQSFAETRKKISANADALRQSLVAFRHQFASDVASFRADVRAEQAETSLAVAADLKSFVAGVKAQSDDVRQAVQHQLTLVRAAWGQSAAPVVAPVEALAAVSSIDSVNTDKKTESETKPESTFSSEFEAPAPVAAKETMSGFARHRKRENFKASSSEDEGLAGNLSSAGQTE